MGSSSPGLLATDDSRLVSHRTALVLSNELELSPVPAPDNDVEGDDVTRGGAPSSISTSWWRRRAWWRLQKKVSAASPVPTMAAISPLVTDVGVWSAADLGKNLGGLNNTYLRLLLDLMSQPHLYYRALPKNSWGLQEVPLLWYG